MPCGKYRVSLTNKSINGEHLPYSEFLIKQSPKEYITFDCRKYKKFSSMQIWIYQVLIHTFQFLKIALSFRVRYSDTIIIEFIIALISFEYPIGCLRRGNLELLRKNLEAIRDHKDATRSPPDSRTKGYSKFFKFHYISCFSKTSY